MTIQDLNRNGIQRLYQISIYGYLFASGAQAVVNISVLFMSQISRILVPFRLFTILNSGLFVQDETVNGHQSDLMTINKGLFVNLLVLVTIKPIVVRLVVLALPGFLPTFCACFLGSRGITGS